MRVRAALGERTVRRRQRLAEPAVEVAAVGKRAALDHATLVDPVEEEAAARLRDLRLVQRPKRARGPDHQRGTPASDAACTEVRACAVDPRRMPVPERLVRDRRQPGLVESERVEQLAIPAARVHVEDPGAFTVPWNGRILYQRVEPGRAERVFPPGVNSGATEAGPLLEKSCAENPFSYFGNDGPSVRRADRPDF